MIMKLKLFKEEDGITIFVTKYIFDMILFKYLFVNCFQILNLYINLFLSDYKFL